MSRTATSLHIWQVLLSEMSKERHTRTQQGNSSWCRVKKSRNYARQRRLAHLILFWSNNRVEVSAIWYILMKTGYNSHVHTVWNNHFKVTFYVVWCYPDTHTLIHVVYVDKSKELNDKRIAVAWIQLSTSLLDDNFWAALGTALLPHLDYRK